MRSEWLAADADEVQCGIGRSGKWFAFQHSGIFPRCDHPAKGLVGRAIGACLGRGLAFLNREHASTFGGNHWPVRLHLRRLR
jgi:acetylornithine aminotransferase